MARTLDSIAKAMADVPHTLLGNGRLTVERLAPIDTAGPADIAFVAHVRYSSKVAHTQAGCLIVSPALQTAAEERGACFVTPDPYLFFARLTQWWRAEHQTHPVKGIHPSAVVSSSAELGVNVSVGPFAVIEDGAVIAAGTVVGAHAFVGRDARVGSNCLLHPRVTVAYGCTLGKRCVVHSGAVIGADGFGFAQHQGQWIKIEQLGAVRIGNDVEIGANTCIDRGALDDTVIEDGVKLDNLVQIGHNVHIGAHSAMAGCAGVAGSAHIGAGCTVGGGAVVLGHLTLANGVHVSAASVVTRSISAPGQYTGIFPIDDNASWEKNAASLKQLNKLRERIKAVEHAIAQTNSKISS
jgi:UDP-3-O-[3-hydroxymyristoyl] glucosamine N-acyltransferase